MYFDSVVFALHRRRSAKAIQAVIQFQIIIAGSIKSNYIYLEKPHNIDVSWETQIAMKVNKYLSVNFNTQLINDDNTKIKVNRNNDGTPDLVPGSRIQFKEILGVGFSYKF